MTDAERYLWLKIRMKQMKGYHFYRQKPIGSYIVDFYCSKAKLVLEIDGSQHLLSENSERDKTRDSYLRTLGLNVLRFNNNDVLKNIEGVLHRIAAELD